MKFIAWLKSLFKREPEPSAQDLILSTFPRAYPLVQSGEHYIAIPELTEPYSNHKWFGGTERHEDMWDMAKSQIEWDPEFRYWYKGQWKLDHELSGVYKP